jgi:hypothetical protein
MVIFGGDFWPYDTSLAKSRNLYPEVARRTICSAAGVSLWLERLIFNGNVSVSIALLSMLTLRCRVDMTG